MTINDLRQGMTCVLKNRERYKIQRKQRSSDEKMQLFMMSSYNVYAVKDFYTETLESVTTNPRLDIVKVMDEKGNILWEREQKDELAELLTNCKWHTLGKNLGRGRLHKTDMTITECERHNKRYFSISFRNDCMKNVERAAFMGHDGVIYIRSDDNGYALSKTRTTGDANKYSKFPYSEEFECGHYSVTYDSVHDVYIAKRVEE